MTAEAHWNKVNQAINDTWDQLKRADLPWLERTRLQQRLLALCDHESTILETGYEHDGTPVQLIITYYGTASIPLFVIVEDGFWMEQGWNSWRMLETFNLCTQVQTVSIPEA